MKSTDSGRSFPGARRYFRVASENTGKMQADSEANDGSKNQAERQDGLLVVKEGGGVFYIRYDIIFAKAGDVFFMPRKVPEGFIINSDTILTKEELKQYENLQIGI
jgi:hypothetical protein